MSHPTGVRQFMVVFIATSVAVILVVRSELVEHISYAVEKGRLRALQEALPPEEMLEELYKPTRAVAEIVKPAVVHIETYRGGFRLPRALTRRGEGSEDALSEFEKAHPWLKERLGSDGVMTLDELPQPPGLGSGFVYDAQNGFVVTNAHVIDGAERIEVIVADGRRFLAEVVGIDHDSDLAVIRIPARRLHGVELGDSSNLAVGDDVFALGNPFGLDGTFSRGIVSALGRSDLSINGVVYEGFIQTDAVINPGNSGGPLVNRRGEVVGVNTAIATESGQYSGVGFAIPSVRVAQLVPQLIESGEVVRGFLGVATDNVRGSRGEAEGLGWANDYGVIIISVVPDSPADMVAVRQLDILAELNGERIRNRDHLKDVVAAIKPGTAVTLRLWRDGAFVETEVTLAERPNRI